MLGNTLSPFYKYLLKYFVFQLSVAWKIIGIQKLLVIICENTTRHMWRTLDHSLGAAFTPSAHDSVSRIQNKHLFLCGGPRNSSTPRFWRMWLCPTIGLIILSATRMFQVKEASSFVNGAAQKHTRLGAKSRVREVKLISLLQTRAWVTAYALQSCTKLRFKNAREWSHSKKATFPLKRRLPH